MGVTTQKERVGFRNDNRFDCRKQNLYVGDHIDVMQKRKRTGTKPTKEGTHVASKTIYGVYHHFGTYATKAEADQAIREGQRVIYQSLASDRAKKAKKAKDGNDQTT